jgi:hypothetical protein
MPNFRRKARGRPQILQRLCRRVENFGLASLLARALLNIAWIFASFTRFAVVANLSPNSRLPTVRSHLFQIPKFYFCVLLA